MAKSDSGKKGNGAGDQAEEQRKKDAEEGGAIEIDVHEEKVPPSTVKVRKEDS